MTATQLFSRALVVSILVLTFLPITASAQISFEKAFIDAQIGLTLEPVGHQASSGQESAILALNDMTGASQTWDFTMLSFDDPSGDPVIQEYLALPDASLPGSTDPRVADATFAIKSTDPAATPGDYFVVYFGATSSQYNTYGTWAIANGQDVDMLYDTPLLSHTFPLEFGSQWSGQTTYSQQVSSFTTNIMLEQNGNANGWGTLITPAGTVEALRYELEINTSTDFFGTTTNVTSTVINFVSHEGISASITITEDPQGGDDIITASYATGGTSDSGSNDPPASAPTTPDPAIGATVSTSPTLGWDPVDDASAYDLQVATATFGKSPGQIVVDETGITTTSFQASGLSGGTAYFWRVRATNGNGAGDWSTSFSFMTEADPVVLPGDVTLTAPADAAIDLSTSIDFTWNVASDAATYDFQLASDAGFTALVREETALAATNILVADLENETTYHWRVRGVNTDGEGNWTEASFTTETAPLVLPGTVTLSVPADVATDIDMSPTLSWQAASDATSYDVQVSTDASFATTTVNETGVTGTELAIGPLAASTVHLWRVRGVNTDGTGVWSSASFTTASDVAIERSDDTVPTEFALHEAYPNPFNPQTTIRFDTDRTSRVSLTVWDVSGRLVDTIVDGSLAAGRYSYRWNASGRPSGLYLIRLQSVNRVQTSRVMLIK